ncbi:Rho GTPase activation protein, partial [Dichotomocladium elegans]
MSSGISVEGIFRRSGSTAMIEKLMNEFQTVNDPWAIDLSSVSIHSVAGLFKRYLQQLSEPVVPMSFQPELLNAYESTPSTYYVYQKRDRLIGACQALPQKHCELLSLVLYTAHAISRHSDQNKMSAENLAIIFAPTCIRLDGLAHLLSDDSSAKSTHKGSTITISDNNKPSQVKTRLEQGIGNFCRSVLSRPKHAMDEEKPRSTYSVLRYAPDKLMELNLIKENSRWNKLFEFMINHP